MEPAIRNKSRTILKNIAFYIFLIPIVSCGQQKKNEIAPYQLIISENDQQLAFGLQYQITQTEMNVVIKGGHVEKDDGIIFTHEFKPNNLLQSLSELNVDSIHDKYENPCLVGGMELAMLLIKDNKRKLININNYHHPILGEIVELINSIVPSSLRIKYNKHELIKNFENCNLIKH